MLMQCVQHPHFSWCLTHWLFFGWGEAMFGILVTISGSSGLFLVWLYCLWMVRCCSICRCHRRWCQWMLVVVQLASWAAYQASSAVRLCVPHVWHILPLHWPAASEVEAAFLTSNLRCSFILSLPASIWLQWSETSLDSFIKSFTSPFFTPSPQSCTLASTSAVQCVVSTPVLCLDRIIASRHTFLFR